MKGFSTAIAFVIVACGLCFTFVGIPLVALWVFLIFAGAPTRAEKARGIIGSTMMANEVIEVQDIQHRIFALFQRRSVVAITNHRIVIVRRGLLGGFKMSDIQWKDLADARIDQNIADSICGSNLVFKHLDVRTGWMSVDGVHSDLARQIYARAQAEEQAWEEKRRVRAMEEVRAAAGGVVVHTAATAPAAEASGNKFLADIQKAKAMLDAGVITEVEFQEMKAKILAAA